MDTSIVLGPRWHWRVNLFALHKNCWKPSINSQCFVSLFEGSLPAGVLFSFLVLCSSAKWPSPQNTKRETMYNSFSVP